jgi:polar amino acid transport system permease protein
VDRRWSDHYVKDLGHFDRARLVAGDHRRRLADVQSEIAGLVQRRLHGVFPQHASAGSSTILPEFVNQWLYRHDFEFAAGTIALTVYTAAFIAEEIRSGVFSIPKTQLEASRAVGLSFIQAYAYVILPQAFRIVIPPLISQFLNLIKNSSLVMTIGVMDLTYMARQIESYTFHGFEAFTVATLIYLCISLIVSLLITQYNKYFLREIVY